MYSYSEDQVTFRDFHLNEVPFYDDREYSMDLYNDRMKEIIKNHDVNQPLFLYAAMQTPHSPLQVPEKYEDMYPDNMDPKRRTFLGMVTAMDDVIGDLISKLKESGLYENSVIIFSSDNGAVNGIRGGGSNYPLRGQKGSFYEGGVRVPAFIHSPKYVKNPGRTYYNLVHISDWFPTIMHLTNFEDFSSIDGIDQYEALFQEKKESIPRLI